MYVGRYELSVPTSGTRDRRLRGYLVSFARCPRVETDLAAAVLPFDLNLDQSIFYIFPSSLISRLHKVPPEKGHATPSVRALTNGLARLAARPGVRDWLSATRICMQSKLGTANSMQFSRVLLVAARWVTVVLGMGMVELLAQADNPRLTST